MIFQRKLINLVNKSISEVNSNILNIYNEYVLQNEEINENNLLTFKNILNALNNTDYRNLSEILTSLSSINNYDLKLKNIKKVLNEADFNLLRPVFIKYPTIVSVFKRENKNPRFVFILSYFSLDFLLVFLLY